MEESRLHCKTVGKDSYSAEVKLTLSPVPRQRWRESLLHSVLCFAAFVHKSLQDVAYLIYLLDFFFAAFIKAVWIQLLRHVLLCQKFNWEDST